jgi:hypothetical protein
MGRGVSLINLFGIGAAGLMQIITGRIHTALSASETAQASAPYAALFLFCAGLTTLGLVVYLFARDRVD